MKLRASLVLLTTLVLVVGVSTSKRHSRRNGELLEDWQKKVLDKIQWNAKEGGLSQDEVDAITKYNKDLCYTRDCLESALEIVSATNFTVDPCKPDNWINFVCWRRVTGDDNLGQGEKLAKETEGQTIALLKNQSEALLEKEFLLKEAQTYYYQCTHKADHDKEDVKQIYEWMTDTFGDWPIFSNGEPTPGKFNWLDMVADQNRFQRQGFQPLIFQSGVYNNANYQGVFLSPGRLTLPSANDIEAVLKIVQKNAKLKKPARTEKIYDMIQFLSGFVYSNNANDVTLRISSIQHLQSLTDDLLLKLQSQSEEYGQEAKEMNVDWLQFFQTVFKGSDIEITPETTVITPYNKILGMVETMYYLPSMRPVADALHFHLASVLLQESTTLLDDITGFKCTEQSGARDWICLHRVMDIFAYSLGKTWLNTYYDEEGATPALRQMMDKIKKGYRDVIRSYDWLSAETKSMLIRKVDNMRTHYAMPDEMREDPEGFLREFYKGFDGATDKQSSYPINYLKITNWETMKKASWTWKRLGQIRSKDTSVTMWDYTWSRWLGTVNANYAKTMNEARIEGGIVQSPLFGAKKPGFMNYGGLGMVLAHEIGHGYDTTGVKYNDKNEEVENFWDDASRSRYQDWVDKILKDYGSEGHQTSDTSAETIDPYKTVNDDIADILGVFISFNSYSEYLKELESQWKKEKVLPGLTSFTPHKLFYMKYANMWCDKKEVQDQYNDLLGDHSPGNTRATLPLKYSRQFADTFGCPVPGNAV